MATQTCTIKRVPFADGQSGLPEIHIADLACTPLMSVDETGVTASRAQALGSAMVGRKQVMVFENKDIKSGDLLVLNGKEYPIVEVNPWNVSEPFMTLIVNEVQANIEPEAIFTR